MGKNRISFRASDELPEGVDPAEVERAIKEAADRAHRLDTTQRKTRGGTEQCLSNE